MKLDKWIRGYIAETGERGVIIPKGDTIDNNLKRFESIQSPHIGMYCKEPYIILDIDGCNKNKDTGEYGNLDNATKARELITKYCKNAIIITTTHGGINAIFKRPTRKTFKQSEYTTYGGLCVEYKPSNGKVTIQRDYKIRDIQFIGNPQSEDVDTLPLWLEPFTELTNWTNDYKGSIANGKLDSGYNIDNFIHKLASYSKLTTEQRKELVSFINIEVLNNPLPSVDKFLTQSEMKPIKQESDDIGSICDELLSIYQVIKSNDILYYFNGQVYKPFDKIARKYIGQHSSNKRNTFKNDCLINLKDILDNWKLHDYDSDDSRYGVDLYEWVATPSELYNCLTGERKPFTSELFIRKQLAFDIPTESKPNMVDEIVNKLLLGNEKDIQLWWEYMGYCLCRTVNFERMLTLNGSGSNGKSVLLDLMTEAYNGLCEPYAFKNLFAKFGGIALERNYFVFAHEMTSEYQKDSTNFKECISNNTRQVEPKGKDYITLENYNCKFVYANNGVTNMDASSAEAVARRQLPLLLEYKIEESEKEANFYERWLTKENCERFLYLAVKHIPQLIERGCFELSERSQNEINRYITSLDTVKQWVDEVKDDLCCIEPKDALYKRYKWWCNDDGCNPCKKIEFGKRLNKYLPYTTTKAMTKDNRRVNAYNFSPCLGLKDCPN